MSRRYIARGMADLQMDERTDERACEQQH